MDKKSSMITKIQLILFFVYLFLIYVFGGDSQRIKYSEIVLVLFTGLEGLNILKERKIKYSIPIALTFIFTFYCFLSKFWAINPDLAINRAKTLFLLDIFLLTTYNFFSRIKKSEEILLKSIMYVGMIFSIYVILYYGIGEYFQKLINGERVGYEINNVNTIGMQTAISIIIAVFYMLYENKKRYLLFSIFPLIVALGTGSRKVILMIACGMVLLFLLERENKLNIINIAKKSIMFLCVIVVISIIAKLSIFSTIFERFEGMTNLITGNGSIDASTEARDLYIKAGIKQFLQTPFLGIGLNNSGYITRSIDNNFTYLHNNYVELLATVGIIGFCLYYTIYFYIIIFSIRHIKSKNKYINIILVIFVVNLVLEYGLVAYYEKSTYIYFLLGIITIEKMKRNIRLEMEKKNE